MSMPYSNPPEDRYSTDRDQYARSEWDYPQQQPAPMVPYNPAPVPSEINLAALEAKRERQAVTGRIAIALSLAIPLTAIAGGIAGGMGSSFTALVAMAMTWFAIGVIVYLSHGKGFPYPRQH